LPTPKGLTEEKKYAVGLFLYLSARYVDVRFDSAFASILEKMTRARQWLEPIAPGSTPPKRRSSTAINRRARA